MQSRRELTVSVTKEILEGALTVERTLVEMVEATEAAEEEVVGGNDETSAEPTGVTPSRPNNKRKGVFSVDDTEGGNSSMAESAVSKPQKKHKNVEIDRSSTLHLPRLLERLLHRTRRPIAQRLLSPPVQS